MAKRKKDWQNWGIPDSEPSPANTDPIIEIWVKAIHQALKDLQSRDPLLCLDAFAWLVFASEVETTLGLIGLPEDMLLGIGRVADVQNAFS